jgi:hypothetical protein
MLKWIAGAAIVVAGAGVASVASASPPETDTFVCDGKPTEIYVHGRVGEIDGVKYLAYNVEVSGSFDPKAPGEPTQTFEDTQWTNASRTGGLQCSSHEVTDTGDGIETFDISLNAIPIGKP